ncbi:MAG TPA: hypothetical protein VD906_15110 [Caulobacteraceae bacterium]|nr:hypothetical protein [Caulobacteraceae bacterium]
MIKLAAILALTLGACASESSYSLGQGTVTYDELQRQTEACKARGGTIRPNNQSELSELSNYSCVIPRGS